MDAIMKWNTEHVRRWHDCRTYLQLPSHSTARRKSCSKEKLL